MPGSLAWGPPACALRLETQQPTAVLRFGLEIGFNFKASSVKSQGPGIGRLGHCGSPDSPKARLKLRSVLSLRVTDLPVLTGRSCGRPSLWIGRSNAPWPIRMVPGAQFEAQAACALHKEPPAALAGGSTQGELGFRLHSQWVRTGFPLRGSRAVWVVPSLKLLPPKIRLQAWG